MSDEMRLPCREGNPDDWFIREDGKQYPSDSLLTPEQVAEIFTDSMEIMPEGTSREELEASVDRAVERAEADAKTAALARRRHAKEACVFSCPIRVQCLTKALDRKETHGTWGGHYEEELQVLHIEIARRRSGSLPLLD